MSWMSWMSCQDFVRHFTILELVTLGVETDSYQEDADDDEDDDHRDDKFEVFYEHGSWTRHVNAGGCKNFVDTFWTNPQYAFSLEEPDDNCAEGLCTCIIALMQKDRRRYLKQGLSFHSIGFALYDAGSGDDDHDDEGDPARRRDSVFDQQWFRDNAPNAVSMFCKSREVSLRLRLKPGDYVIIPSTFRPNEEANFILRVFTAKKPVEHHLRDNMDTSVRVVDDIRMSRQRRVKRHTGFRRRRVSRDILDSSLDLIAENEEDEDDDVYDDPATMSSTATATATRTLRRAADREAQLRRLFRSAADEPEERLDAFALKEVLHQAFKKESWFMKFSAETSKTLMALADEEFVGKIDYEQFSLLWTTVLKAKDIFVEFDRQQQGSMEGFELRKALSSLGFQISLDTFKILVLRYGDREGRVHFEDFLQCVAKLKRLMRQDEKMSTHSVRLCGKIMIDRECFMNAVLYT